jgi:acyl carrier protein
MKERRWSAVRLHSIPNSRLSREAAAQSLIETSDERLEVTALRRQLNELQFDGIDPEKFWELAEAHGYDATVSPDEHDCFEVQLVDRALREYLKGLLPEYMIPSAWMMLKQLPLTPNGKVDRRALPAPQSRPDEMGEYIAPRTDVERALADIWAQVLRVDQVGVQDNFFELGGHSLLATQVIVRIQTSLSIEMSMRLLFEFPTIQQLGAQLDDLRQARLLEKIAHGEDDIEELLEEVASLSGARP